MIKTDYQYDISDESSYNGESHKSPSQQSATITQVPPSSAGNGVSFYFTEHPNGAGWNSKGPNAIQDSEDEDDTFAGHELCKSYEEFERKLQEGYLDAPNLGLLCAPPAMFDYTPPLKRVDLKDNKIETLPDHFFDELPMLEWCDLRYNRLKVLPLMNSTHDCLKVLLLQDNQLCDLPYSLAYATNLHTLGWTNNHIIEPPRQILLQGCKRTMEYLRSKLMCRLPVDEEGNLSSLKTDEQLENDLKKTAKKSVFPKRSVSRTSLTSGKSGKSAEDMKREELEHKKRIDRIKYTWGLWKNIPYDGVTNQKLFEKSVQEVKDELKAKLNQDKEALLQRMKDNEALGKWRWDARMLQMKGPEKPYDGVSMPFGTDADVNHNHGQSESMVLSPEKFKQTVTECLEKLQEFASTPAPVNDLDKSFQRLKEVEDIQRKLLDMKVMWSVKTSDPV